MSSRSSPLLAAPRSPCPESGPEPFSDGAEVHVANLDYRMSRKDLQQTLHNTFSRYGRVRLAVVWNNTLIVCTIYPLSKLYLKPQKTNVSLPTCAGDGIANCGVGVLGLIEVQPCFQRCIYFFSR